MDLIDHLQALSARAQQTGSNLTNEEATKMALIAPFLQALGYDIFNPNEVMPEFSADLPMIKQGERVDYAILENGEPKILVEAKPYATNLKTAEKGQLQRYFHATQARIGILSNGRIFHFYSDLDAPNVMDDSPFAEVDLLDLDNAPITEVKRLSKAMFDIDTLLSTAEKLKYLRGVKEEIKKELTTPSEWFVKEMAARIHSGKQVTAKVKELFEPIVADAIDSYINNRIAERLKSAMQAEGKSAQESQEVETDIGEDPNALVTTQEELDGLYITRAICASEIDPSRLIEKDTKNYFNVLLDGKSQKAVVRLYFNGKKKSMEICDAAEPANVDLDGPSGIYQYADRIRAALKLKLG
ncbi:type I restriction endonuclease [Synechococcus sp. CS-1332]|uniref:type I restriction endonuclease n=1 Tax=Synechococcus sp. CS-1332 TaxID=2847972 RepID=UPI00223B5AA9|nr:type I restriction endonuclease [Synechococcus sp. CS-1332]MCT0208668.1 type I restriction enzyme HsdR N-terminal domain-containing protein [Synechococcus sp. CS-1332]